MASLQLTLDGKPAPAAMPRAKKQVNCPETTCHSVNTHFHQTVREEQRHRKPTKGPMTPAQELGWQETNRITQPLKHEGIGSTAPGFTGAQQDDLRASHKMDLLLDWHANCPGSQAYPPEDDTGEDFYPELYGPPADPNGPLPYYRVPSNLKPCYDE